MDLSLKQKKNLERLNPKRMILMEKQKKDGTVVYPTGMSINYKNQHYSTGQSRAANSSKMDYQPSDK